MSSSETRSDQLATSVEVAQYLQKPKATLDQWAYRGIGPRFIKVGNARRYRWRDVEAWLEEHTVEVA